MSARKVIALQLIRSTGYDAADTVFDSPFTERSRLGEAWSAAGIAVNALEAAGYRILAPGELDGETLEAAAKVADDVKLRDHPRLSPGSEMNAWWSGQSAGHEDVAAAIRNLRSAG